MLHVHSHMRITQLTTWFSKMATLLTYMYFKKAPAKMRSLVMKNTRKDWKIHAHQVKSSIKRSFCNQLLYADLTGKQPSDAPITTIPHNAITITLQPDVVLCSGNDIKLLELTVCSSNTAEGFSNACLQKYSKQVYLVSDLESNSYTYDNWISWTLYHLYKKCPKIIHP